MKCEAIVRRRPVNLYLAEDLVTKAKELGINISRACETGLSEAVRAEEQQRWEEDNRPAIEGWNRWTAKNGLPLAKYRRF